MNFQIPMSDSRKIGFGLTMIGMLFIFLGVLLLFDSLLLTMGNVLFLAGMTLAIGTKSTATFFMQRKKWKGSACFFFGILVVLFGSPILGILVQAFGFVNLFGDFFPTALRFARSLPVIGVVLRLPVISQALDKILNSGRPV